MESRSVQATRGADHGNVLLRYQTFKAVLRLSLTPGKQSTRAGQITSIKTMLSTETWAKPLREDLPAEIRPITARHLNRYLSLGKERVTM